MINQYELDQENFAGRLHRSQRRRVIAGIIPGLLVLIGGLVVIVLAVVTVPDASPASLLYLIPVFAAVAFGLWIVGRRVLELGAGRVTAFSGWTGQEISIYDSETRSHPDYGKRALADVGRGTTYSFKIDEREFRVDRELYERIQPECNNTAFLMPRTKRVVNVARTP
jgi:hypothetical protein